MSVRVQSLVREHSRATGNTRIVLLKIADNCDASGTNAWPSIEQLARYCRCSESTVKRAIRELKELGELEVVVNGGGGKRAGTRYATNLYRLVIEGGQIDTPDRPGGSNSAFRGVKIVDSGGSPVDPNSLLEPSRTAAETNFELSKAHLRLAREALGIEVDKDASASRPSGTGGELP